MFFYTTAGHEGIVHVGQSKHNVANLGGAGIEHYAQLDTLPEFSPQDI